MSTTSHHEPDASAARGQRGSVELTPDPSGRAAVAMMHGSPIGDELAGTAAPPSGPSPSPGNTTARLSQADEGSDPSSSLPPPGQGVPPRGGGDPPDATGRRHVVLPTAIGDLQVVATATAIVGVYHANHDPVPSSALLGQALARDDVAQASGAESDCGTASEAGARSRILSTACGELVEYLDGRRRSFEVPIYAQGTTFQRKVWSAIEQIPYGQRCSYRDIATALGNSGMGRAVGAAVRANPLSIVIPGHRVVGRKGAVTGYAAGTVVKSRLLELEARLTTLDAGPAESGGTPVSAERGQCEVSTDEEVVESEGGPSSGNRS